MLGYNIGDVHHLQCTLVVWIACFVTLLYSVTDPLIHLLKHSSAESAILCALAKSACVSICVQSHLLGIHSYPWMVIEETVVLGTSTVCLLNF